MKRIAIPVIDGNLCKYLEQSQEFKVYEIRTSRVTSHMVSVPKELEIAFLPLWVSEQGITDVVTYKIDGRIMHLFAQYKISLYIGIKCKSPDEIIQRYLNGTLRCDEHIISEINKNR